MQARAERAVIASGREAWTGSDDEPDIAESLRRVVAALLGTGLGAIAGLHVYWGLGGDAGLRAAIGGRDIPAWIRPASFGVAVNLVVAALSMFERVAASLQQDHPDDRPARAEVIRPWAARGRWIVALGLSATGVVNLTGRSTLERAGFAPLCLTLAALAAFVARSPAPAEATGLDHWLPRYHVREVHERLVDGDPRQALAAVLSQDVVGDPVVRVLFRLRRLDATPMTLARFTSSGGFTVLERSETTYVVGEHIRRPALQIAADFRSEPAGRGRTRLVTETRVLAEDRVSLLVFRAYWLLVRPFSGLIRRRWLHAAAATTAASTTLPA